MDQLDKQLLTQIQSEFPLVSRPFQKLAGELGAEEREILKRVVRLKQENVIREISAIFDAKALGYQSALIAMKLPADRLDAAAEHINRLPGVGHNYERADEYNLWFTLAVPQDESLEEIVGPLANEVEVHRYRVLPTVRRFKIGVRLDWTTACHCEPRRYVGAKQSRLSKIVERIPSEIAAARCAGLAMTNEEWALRPPRNDKQNSVGAPPRGCPFAPGKESAQRAGTGARPYPLSFSEIEAVRLLQEDLPLEPRPFRALAEMARDGSHESKLYGENRSWEDQLLATAHFFLNRGFMRRFAAVVNHRNLGYAANAMVVWRVPQERVEEIGLQLAQFPQVTHCYERPAVEDFPYSLYTMVHGKTREECETAIGEMTKVIGRFERKSLYSVREFKKSRPRYFVEVAKCQGKEGVGATR